MSKTKKNGDIASVMHSFITIQKHFSEKRVTVRGKDIEECLEKKRRYYPSWYQVVFEAKEHYA